MFGDVEGTVWIYQFNETEGRLECSGKKELWTEKDKIIPGNITWYEQASIDIVDAINPIVVITTHVPVLFQPSRQNF